jgi:hypothetical protein
MLDHKQQVICYRQQAEVVGDCQDSFVFLDQNYQRLVV